MNSKAKSACIYLILFVLTLYKGFAQKNLSSDSLAGFSNEHAWEHTNSLKTLEEKNQLFETIKRN